MGIYHIQIPSLGAIAFICYAAQLFKLHILPLGFNPGVAAGTQGIGICSAAMCSLHRQLLDNCVCQ